MAWSFLYLWVFVCTVFFSIHKNLTESSGKPQRDTQKSQANNSNEWSLQCLHGVKTKQREIYQLYPLHANVNKQRWNWINHGLAIPLGIGERKGSWPLSPGYFDGFPLNYFVALFIWSRSYQCSFCHTRKEKWKGEEFLWLYYSSKKKKLPS